MSNPKPIPAHIALEEAAQACRDIGAGFSRLGDALDTLALEAEEHSDRNRAIGAEQDGSSTLPLEVFKDLCAEGARPIRILRKWRGLTQAQLAKSAGIRQASLSALEAKPGTGNVETLSRLAQALEVAVDDLLPPAEPSPLEDAPLEDSPRDSEEAAA